MKFRYARHTTALQPLIDFYTTAVGLSVLGSFKDHDGYDGVFLSIPGQAWHVEFTASHEAPVHHADEDDALVFYPSTKEEYDTLVNKLKAATPELVAKNPYWQNNGTTFADPDGFRVVIARPA